MHVHSWFLMTVNLIVCIAICRHAIPDLTFTALQYLAVEYCERNQRRRSWGATTSQEPWFWKDISWASSFEDNRFCKYFCLSWRKLLALYFGCCCFQQRLFRILFCLINIFGFYVGVLLIKIQGLRLIIYFSTFCQFYKHFNIITSSFFRPGSTLA